MLLPISTIRVTHGFDVLDKQSDKIKKEVEDAKNRFNTVIREAIRFETRLRLNRGKDDESVYGHSDSSVSKVSVNVLIEHRHP